MKKYIVTLTKDEHEAPGALTSKGNHKSQKIIKMGIPIYQTKGLVRLPIIK